MIRWIILGALCCQSFAQPPGVMNLSDALALAERHNPRLTAAMAQADGAEAAALTSRAYLNPNLTVGTLGRQQVLHPSAVGGMVHGFTLQQPLDLPSVRRTRIAAADHGRLSGQHALSETRLEVHALVKQAFYEVLRRKGEAGLAEGTLRLLEDLRRRIQVRVDVGEAARLELVRADAEVSAARIQTERAKLQQAVALAGLAAAIGAPLAGVEPQEPLRPPVELPPLLELRREVEAAHPSIALGVSETRRAEAALEYERAQRKPQPTLWADVFRQPDTAQYRFGISLPLPLWNRREGPIAEAVAARRRAAALADQRLLEISAALDRAYSLYQVTGQELQLFEAGTLRQAEAALQAAEAAFRFGERGILEVLDAQRVLRAIRLDYLNAQFDQQQALIEIERLRAKDTRRVTP